MTLNWQVRLKSYWFQLQQSWRGLTAAVVIVVLAGLFVFLVHRQNGNVIGSHTVQAEVLSSATVPTRPDGSRNAYRYTAALEGSGQKIAFTLSASRPLATGMRVELRADELDNGRVDYYYLKTLGQ